MDLLQYVNPLQGTASEFNYSNGNTLPLVTMPFGMASWSPQTNEKGGGWYFNSSHHSFQGIRLTHQPSPWIGDYGHLVIMPQSGPLHLPSPERASSFRQKDMIIKPDYFYIKLLRYRATLELTPTVRCASIRTRFTEDDARLIIAPFDGESSMVIDQGKRQVRGFTRAKSGGAPDSFAMYFVIEFDCEIDIENSSVFDTDFKSIGSQDRTGERVGAYIGLRLPETKVAGARIGTSFISIEQAQSNLHQEVGDRCFEDVRNEAVGTWNEMLGKIEVDTSEEEKIRTFYTCMYRTFLFPRVWYEYDEAGRKVHYSPYSGKIHEGPMYSDNGFWDTYRTNYPLLCLLCPSRMGEILESWVNAYKEGGWMPKWVSPGERSAMPGTLIDPVFADAFVKGIKGFDAEAAYEGLIKHATIASEKRGCGRYGLKAYQRLGYLPADSFHESVSNSLDYIYGDYCIAQIAKGLRRMDDYRLLMGRAVNYAKLFDSSIGFMRGRCEDGSWKKDFNPVEWGGEFCEGGAWQCSWAVQHDLLGLTGLMGGRQAFLSKLDELMTMPPVFKIGTYPYEIHEMSEMASVDFGQFAISNQPSFHIPYIFTALGYPSRTQYWVRKALDELFSSQPNGLPGDEDNGSLCAWYIFGAMGIYPLCPGTTEYVLGSPIFKHMTIKLENGHELVIEAENHSPQNVYVKGIKVNEQDFSKLFINHSMLTVGGSICFEMTDTPSNKEYADEDLPFSLSVHEERES